MKDKQKNSFLGIKNNNVLTGRKFNNAQTSIKIKNLIGYHQYTKYTHVFLFINFRFYIKSV